jgi:hypothetical protein
LGVGRIELADLEPLEAVERTIPISSPKLGNKGEIRVSMLFRPGVIARSRHKTSTFSSAGRAMTQIGGLPFEASRGLAHGVTFAGSKAFGVFKKDKQSDSEDGHPLPQVPPALVLQPTTSNNGGAVPLPSTNIALPPGITVSPPELGTLRVTVVSAKDLSIAQPGETIRPYAIVRLGEKEFKTRHASKTTTPEWFVSHSLQRSMASIFQ